MIAADEQMIDRAHAAGLSIIGATIIPRGGAGEWNPIKEQRAKPSARLPGQHLRTDPVHHYFS